MRLILWHKTAVYIAVGAAFLPILTSQEPGLLVLFLTLMGYVVSWFTNPKGSLSDTKTAHKGGKNAWYYKIAWNLALLTVIGLVFINIVVRGVSIINGGITLILFLTISKLCNRHSFRDYYQIYALSLVLMATGTVLNQSITYGIAFVVYSLSGTVAMSLHHLCYTVREGPYMQSGDIIGWRFISNLIGLSILILSISLVVFFLFPRVGMGLFNIQTRTGLSMSGFEDSIDLTDHGLIRDNYTPVMRITLPKSPPGVSISHLHWRGISFDHFDGKGWSKRFNQRMKVSRTPDGFYTAKEAKLDLLYPQHIYLEPIDSEILFGLHPMSGVQLDMSFGDFTPELLKQSIKIDVSRDYYYLSPNETGLSYIAYSETKPAPSTLRTCGRDRSRQNPMSALVDWVAPKNRRHVRIPNFIAKHYLQLPPSLSKEVIALSERITAGTTNFYDAALKIEQYLKTNYDYTVDLPPRSNDPLYDFLFIQKKGHCEFFSTAMVILLRASGIPARNVNGFLGGRWNSFGEYYVVRQKDAHSWAEAFIPCHGWIEFDATPAGELQNDEESDFWTSLSDYFDSVRTTWFQWVIEYDLAKQFNVAQKSVDFLSVNKSSKTNLRGLIKKLSVGIRKNVLPLLLILLLSLGWAIWLRRGEGPLNRSEKLSFFLLSLINLLLIRLIWHPEQQTMGLLLSLLISLCCLLWVLTKRSPAESAKGHSRVYRKVSRQLTKLMATLNQLGYSREGEESPREQLGRLKKQSAPFNFKLIFKWLDHYEQIRFGPARKIIPGDLRKLRRELRDLIRYLKKSAKQHS